MNKKDLKKRLEKEIAGKEINLPQTLSAGNIEKLLAEKGEEAAELPEEGVKIRHTGRKIMYAAAVLILIIGIGAAAGLNADIEPGIISGETQGTTAHIHEQENGGSNEPGKSDETTAAGAAGTTEGTGGGEAEKPQTGDSQDEGSEHGQGEQPQTQKPPEANNGNGEEGVILNTQKLPTQQLTAGGGCNEAEELILEDFREYYDYFETLEPGDEDDITDGGGNLNALAPSLGSPQTGGSDLYSRDNPDYIKTDGDYIFVCSGGKVKIISAKNPDNVKVVSSAGRELNEEKKEKLTGIHLYKNYLILSYYEDTAYGDSEMLIYDVSNKAAPELVYTYRQKSSKTVTSSVTEGELIIISDYRIDYSYTKGLSFEDACKEIEDVLRPSYSVNGGEYTSVKAENITMINKGGNGLHYIVSTVIDLNSLNEEPKTDAFLCSRCNIAVTGKAVYLYYSVEYSSLYLTGINGSYSQGTYIYKLDITGDGVKFRCGAVICGNVTERLFFDSGDGYLKVITNATDGKTGIKLSMITILDENLNTVSFADGILRGKKIAETVFSGGVFYLALSSGEVYALDASDSQKVKLKNISLKDVFVTILSLSEDGYLFAADFQEGDFAVIDVRNPEKAEVLGVYKGEGGFFMPEKYVFYHLNDSYFSSFTAYTYSKSFIIYKIENGEIKKTAEYEDESINYKKVFRRCIAGENAVYVINEKYITVFAKDGSAKIGEVEF